MNIILMYKLMSITNMLNRCSVFSITMNNTKLSVNYVVGRVHILGHFVAGAIRQSTQ